MLLREKKLLQVERPSSRNYKSYLNYIWNEKPLSRDEYDYVFHKDDMISLGVDSGNGWLGPVVAIITTILPECAMKVMFLEHHIGLTDECIVALHLFRYER